MDKDNCNTTSKPHDVREGVLFGMGNPLLDIMAHVDDAFLEKYKLKANDVILADENHIPIYADLKKNFKVEYVAGGATQNVLRTVQWIVKLPNATTFMGAVGADEDGRTLAQSAQSAGVNVQYQIVPEFPTGTCAALITGANRSLCANLAAADHFTKTHLDNPSHFEFVEKAAYYYISGFFITVSPDSLLEVAKYACSKNRPFMFNLSAPFVSQVFTDRLASTLPYVDILFGNESEARAYSEVHNFGTLDVAEIAIKIASLPKENKQRERIVVFTQGCEPVIVVQGGKVEIFPVNELPPEKIKDTNGAGDAFVGGFLSQYIQGKSIACSVKCGIWSASEVIQQLGCTFPENINYVETH